MVLLFLFCIEIFDLLVRYIFSNSINQNALYLLCNVSIDIRMRAATRARPMRLFNMLVMRLSQVEDLVY